jgi:hypothetical protein
LLRTGREAETADEAPIAASKPARQTITRNLRISDLQALVE